MKRLRLTGMMLLLSAMALAGCNRQPSGEQARAELDRLISIYGGCKFEDGVMDAGIDLVLLPENQAVLITKHFSGGQVYPGRYTLVSSTITNLDFPGSVTQLPDMFIGMDDKTLFIGYASDKNARDASELSGVMRAIPEKKQAGAADFARSYFEDREKPPAAAAVDE